MSDDLLKFLKAFSYDLTPTAEVLALYRKEAERLAGLLETDGASNG